MYKYHYYKHIEGRDAVIYVADVEEQPGGFYVYYTWHVLSYNGTPLPPAVPATQRLFTHRELENWRIHQVD